LSGRRNFTNLEIAGKWMRRIETRFIFSVDCTRVIELSCYFFNSISNPQLKVIGPWLYSEDDFPDQ
jgi:hypothetical protein